MAKSVYIAGVGLTKVDLTGKVFGNVFDLFAQAFERSLEDSRVRSFEAIQVGITNTEEFNHRANIAAKVADRLGLRGVPAIRSETASSTGAAAFHEACYKVASGQCESVLVLAGERMKMVTTREATAIMSKTVDPEERRFGFTMPGIIALITQAWLRERGIPPDRARKVLARLMVRAHQLGSENPLAAFFGRPEPLEAYDDATRNLPVATPLMRKDCSPICDGAAAIILTSRPEGIRVAGLGSATESSSVLDRGSLSCLEATRQAARVAYWRAQIRNPAELSGLVVEAHDAFSSLLPIDLVDLQLAGPDEAIDALIGDPEAAPVSAFSHPVSGPGGRLPVNLSGGLKARGHPVGGTGLFQIGECALQMMERFPNPHAQVPSPSLGIAHSVGGPGNNVYVTVLERSDSRRVPEPVSEPPRRYQAADATPPSPAPAFDGAQATIDAATSIHVTAGGSEGPIHVAVVSAGGQRAFARLDPSIAPDEITSEELEGLRVRLRMGEDGRLTFRPDDTGRFGGLLGRVRERIGGRGPVRSEPPDDGSSSQSA